MYVADSGNARIQRFDATGAFLGKWGRQGTGSGEFGFPVDVATRDDGAIFVVDAASRVQVFDASGAYIGEWGTEGRGDGEFITADAVAVAPDGTVYVSDFYKSHIQAFCVTVAGVATATPVSTST